MHIRSSWWLFTLRVRDLWQTVYILHVIVLYLFSKTNLNNHVPSSKWNVYTPSNCTVLSSQTHRWFNLNQWNISILSWQNQISSFSRSKIGIVRECLSRETVIGPVRSPVQVFSTCELADISQSPSSRVTACLCDTDLCNGNVEGEVSPSSQPQASRRIAPTTERPRSRPEIKETPRGGSNNRPPQRSRSLQVRKSVIFVWYNWGQNIVDHRQWTSWTPMLFLWKFVESWQKMRQVW